MKTYILSFYAKPQGQWVKYSHTFEHETMPTREDVMAITQEMCERIGALVIADHTLQLEEANPASEYIEKVAGWPPKKNTNAWKPKRYGV